MINCNGRKYNTFQEALDNGEDEGRLGEFIVVCSYTSFDEYTFLFTNYGNLEYEVCFELNELLDLLYKAFPEEYASKVNQEGKTDE